MSIILRCQACSNEKFGVKTRKSVDHTCGMTVKEREESLNEFKQFTERHNSFIQRQKNINTYKVLKKLEGELSYTEIGSKFNSDTLYERGYNIRELEQNGYLEIVPILFSFEKEVVGTNHHSVLSVCQECMMQSINLPLNKQCGNCGYHKTITYYDAETIQDHINTLKK